MSSIADWLAHTCQRFANAVLILILFVLFVVGLICGLIWLTAPIMLLVWLGSHNADARNT